MTSTIVNGAGMVKSLGTDDKSPKQVPITPEQIPQHLPMYFIFAQRGDGKHLVDGPTAINVFGPKTFDPREKYFNHQTLFFNETTANANSAMVKRLIPTDAGPKANAIFWLDILVTTVDRLRRNADGSIFYDSMGDPVIQSTTPGLKAKWVKTHRTTLVDQENIGDKTMATGDQTDSVTHATSHRYPIFEVENSYFGADGNNTGFHLWAPTTAGGNSMPTALMNKYNVYPYMFSVIERKSATDTTTLDKTVLGATNVMFTFKKGVVDPVTTLQLGYDQILLSSYDLIDQPGYADIYGRVGKFYVYDANIQTVVDLMYQYEAPLINGFSDITDQPTSSGLMNFVTGTSSQNVPYESFVFVDSSSSIRMSEYSDVFLEGGADGTMDTAMFESLVQAELDRYLDPQDEVQDTAYHVESIFYDSGFGLDTKFKIPQFAALRKDTSWVLGTHAVDEDVLTAAEEHSIAVSLRTRAQMFPESDYFGTPVMRGMIMGRSGQVRDNEYVKVVPMTFEVMSKFSKYMGAGNGAWKNGFSPEGNPGNVVTRMKNINIPWISDLARNLDWDVGLNWVLRLDRSRLFIPAYKTVYTDDTSVLNSMLTALAIGYLNKVTQNAWRTLTGRSDLSGPQLCDRTNAYISQQSQGKFDNRITVVPAATITDLDNLRGFTWSVPVKIGANNMRTVMVTWIEAYRAEDLPSTTSNTTGA